MKCKWIVAAVSAIAIIIGTVVGIHFYNDRASGDIDKLPEVISLPEVWNNLTLMDMSIRTSHNSYLSSFQHLTSTTISAVEEALRMGARSIELDIVNDQGVPYVAHGSGNVVSTTRVAFTNMLNAIAKNAFSIVDDPLIIFLEIYDRDNPILCSSIKNALIDAFGQRLRFFNNLTNKRLINTPLKELKGNVLVIANTNNDDLKHLLEYRYEWANVGSEDPESKSTRSDTVLWRVFPENTFSALSVNMDALPFVKYKYNMIGMNFGTKDDRLYEYLKTFGRYTMVPKHG